VRWAWGRDRLAVRTIVRDGEEIAVGNPLVGDAERAAAGRETILVRERIMWERNRARARETAPDPDAVTARVWWPRDPAALRQRLGSDDVALWSDPDRPGVLHLLWRGIASAVTATGGLDARLWPVPGGTGLWEASLYVRDLRRAVLEVLVFAAPDGGIEPAIGRAPDAMTRWIGPDAPAFPEPATRLSGTISEHDPGRPVTVHIPPDAAGALPGCLLADGQSVAAFAAHLEAAGGPRVVLMGVHSAEADGAAFPDPRNREYCPDIDRSAFDAHLRFVTGSVLPWAAATLPVEPGPWTVAGFSSGATWAIAAAQRHPATFTRVAALSPGIVPRRPSRRASGVRHHLAAGLLEPGFRETAREFATALERAGHAVTHEEWVGGHDSWWWHRTLPGALANLLDDPDTG